MIRDATLQARIRLLRGGWRGFVVSSRRLGHGRYHVTTVLILPTGTLEDETTQWGVDDRSGDSTPGGGYAVDRPYPNSFIMEEPMTPPDSGEETDTGADFSGLNEIDHSVLTSQSEAPIPAPNAVFDVNQYFKDEEARIEDELFAAMIPNSDYQRSTSTESVGGSTCANASAAPNTTLIPDIKDFTGPAKNLLNSMTEAVFDETMVVPDSYIHGKPTSILNVRPKDEKLYIPHEDELMTKFRREAAKFGMDIDLYCYMVTKGLFTGRDNRRFGELKSKAETWLRQERKAQSDLWRASQVMRAMMLILVRNGADEAIFQYLHKGSWWFDGTTVHIKELDDFARKGTVPRSFWKFNWRRLKVPVH